MRVLVTSSGSLLGQGIIRSLLESSLKPEVIACDPDPKSAGLYWTPYRRLLPFSKDPNFMDKFEDLLKEEKPDAVCIGTDMELPMFAERREYLEKTYNTNIIVSNPEVVAIADDKYLTYQFLKKHGFEAPNSALPPDSLSFNVSEFVESLGGFPLIVKPRIGARSVGVRLVRTEFELLEAVFSVKNPVVQECVATGNDEYTAGTLCFDGSCQASIVMRRDLKDGNTFRAYVDDYPELNQQVREICNALQPYGPANFQFRLPASGKIKIFEINSRFSGTTPLRMRAGFNEVEMVLRHLVNGEPIIQPQTSKIVILRHWEETVVSPDTLL